ncbi:MAG: sulfotransferase family protein [Gammaproteobacteria bacterium]|nr:sulfotransferase family protein [Gammaproteobacteria bacterium]
MISHKHRFIFVHVPKTGGTSIEAALGLTGPRHNTARQYRAHDPWLWGQYFTFGFVRNPWDRLVSFYTYRRQIRKLGPESSLDFQNWLFGINQAIEAGEHKLLNDEFAPRLGVGTFVENDPEGWRVKLDNALYMLADEEGKPLVDFIGRYEKLQADFGRVCQRLGIPVSSLPFENKTQRRHYSTYYNDETKELVANLFHRDIANFDYEFSARDADLNWTASAKTGVNPDA